MSPDRRRLLAMLALQLGIAPMGLRTIGEDGTASAILGWMLAAGAILGTGAVAVAWRGRPRRGGE